MSFKPYDEEQRFNQIKRNIPSFITGELKDLLYIGVNKVRFQFNNYLHELKYNITLLEVYTINLESYLDKYTCINADINKFETDEMWDVIMWWHGPEHITKEKLKPTLQKLERMAKKLVILGCPWGKHIHGAVDGNPYEPHINHIYPSDLMKLGYLVESIGVQDKKGSNILAWKIL